MMGESTETNNIEITKRKRADQKALVYTLKKKIKNEHDNEQDYIIH